MEIESASHSISVILQNETFQFDAGKMEDCLMKFCGENFKNPIEFAVVIMDDAEIGNLNFQFRKIKKPTDVLSFSQVYGSISEIAEAIRKPKLKGQPVNLGDIIISWETAARQALEDEIETESEALDLVAHGLLHLLGHDHELDEEAEKMFEIQDAWFKQLNKIYNKTTC